ncbi:putative bifunctional diguanylate cyclase/phosphodiesterase [Vibrio salinus]|uniref:putative bifunctional diguanylate cyclase/phosphodiesterase n=1 Tax=Vibrio salinus TaxID=2899784 RepID=UPI001E4F26BB|nr:bifunctional diguanylate cyclase/phosphodiesterase [Vibrio salinus]MCE0495691.1 bifunctional diguanylate cyclase/phosphodiesterase [Vibrio salinus]
MKQFRYRRLLIALLIVFLIVSVFYFYTLRSIPYKVAQSTDTIQKVDTIRFSFKSAMIAQRGLLIYTDAIHQRNLEIFYNALDHFEAAIGFIHVAHSLDHEFKSVARPKLEQIILLMETYQLDINDQNLQKIRQLVEDIYLTAERRERLVWTDIQSSYVDFKTSEYKVSQLYQTISFATAIVLIVILAQMFFQQKLLKQINAKEAELEKLAYYDSLTDTANRKLIELELSDELERANLNNEKLFIVMVDIDDFKRVNELLGYTAGDLAIIEAVSRIQKVLRSSDKIGRMGGDEFLLVFCDSIDFSDLVKIIGQIQGAFIKPIIVNNQEFYITVSIGVTSSQEMTLNTLDVHDAIKQADIALFKAKSEGKNRYHVYDKQLSLLIEREHQMETEIKNAIDNDQFELYYQPQIEAETGLCVCVEALVRWNHPGKGLLFPADFIQLIEKGYHTKEFGEWVIRRAVYQQKKWADEGIDMRVSVNLAARHVLASDFVFSMKALKTQLNMDPACIHFEITEHELITHEANGFANLESLVNEGFSLYLDDFGTGYSSISYLEKLPLEGIKIDKSFVDYVGVDGNKSQMVNGILTLARAMKLKVVAEGVETKEQACYLSHLRCDYLQGYLIAKPLPAEQIMPLILKNNFSNCYR